MPSVVFPAFSQVQATIADTAVAAGVMADVTVAVPGVQAGEAYALQGPISASLPAGLYIAACYVPAPGQLLIRFGNILGAPTQTGALTFNFFRTA